MTARKLLALPLAFSGGVALASFAACTETNDNHCASRGGDEYCQEKTGKAAGEVFCTNNCGGDYDIDGCLVASEAPAEGCWLCDGQGSENCDGMAEESGSDSDTTTESETATETATETTAETTTETGPECMNATDCDAGTPLCEEGACVGCGEGVMTSCSSEYPETPACDAGTGTCVECTQGDAAACGGMTPVCEGNVCVACSEHSQCAESACNMSTGACMPTDRVWWVNQNAPAGGDGSMVMPFNSFGSALANIQAGEEGTIYFSTADSHNEQAQIASDRTVAIIGKSASGFIQVLGFTAVDINPGATVFIDRMKVYGGDVYGLRCTMCNVWIDRSRIVKNSDGDIVMAGGQMSIRNSFVGGNLASAAALDVTSGSIEVVYSTIAGGALNSAAVECVDGGGVDVRNSLIVSGQVASELNCPGITVVASALEAEVPGNTSLGMMPDFMWFEDYVEGDFGLLPAAPNAIGSAAVWSNGDPATDIDGDPRPIVDGAADYAGADVPN